MPFKYTIHSKGKFAFNKLKDFINKLEISDYEKEYYLECLTELKREYRIVKLVKPMELTDADTRETYTIPTGSEVMVVGDDGEEILFQDTMRGGTALFSKKEGIGYTDILLHRYDENFWESYLINCLEKN